MQGNSERLDTADPGRQRGGSFQAIRQAEARAVRVVRTSSPVVTQRLPIAVGVLVVAWWVGRAMARGGGAQTLLLGIAAVLLLAPLARVAVRRLRYGVLTLELPIVLLVFSTLVFRVRTTNDLAFNPLDPAAQLRVVSVAAALLLGALGFMGRDLEAGQTPGRWTSLPFRLYCLYAVVAWAGAPYSVDPLLTAYRGVELVAGILVTAGAYRSIGRDAGRRIVTTLYWCTVALVGSVWVGVLLVPGQALVHLSDKASPVGTDLEGVYPRFASNGVGTLGVVLAFWSLARLWSPTQDKRRPPRSVTLLLAAVGIVTLIASQYRTGYVAFVAATAVLLVVQKRKVLATVLVAFALTVVYWAPSLITSAQPYLLRGQTTAQARQLSGRVDWWSSAIPVWEKSPLIGRGLLTASRFEVLAPLGDTTTAGLHSTWVEALVGTGLLGLGLLVAAFLVALKRALTVARRQAALTPLLLLTILGTRSITGNTFESFSYEALVFLAISMSLSLPRERLGHKGAFRLSIASAGRRGRQPPFSNLEPTPFRG